jgi:shikimate kinase
MNGRLTLVGYRACGKSTVGRLVSARLGWPFIDADADLERRLGMPIADFFARRGEPAFRAAESVALAEILGKSGSLVFATGGGCVLSAENRGLIRQNGGTVAYLHVPASVLQERLRRDAGGRPSLTGAAVADEVPRLLALREPLYREIADAVIAAEGPPATVAAMLMTIVDNPGQKPPPAR